LFIQTAGSVKKNPDLADVYTEDVWGQSVGKRIQKQQHLLPVGSLFPRRECFLKARCKCESAVKKSSAHYGT
jgi:hypothetical protein